MGEKSSRTEVIARQNTLSGDKPIDIVQFKNLKEKREVKDKIKKLFDGQMIRSILTPREVDGNIRSNKLERQKQSGDRSSTENTMERADSFGKKTLNTLSTFPSMLTISFIKLLSKEGDKVYDPFMGHNSRGEDVLNSGRKYYAYDVHKFPVDFTAQACKNYPSDHYELNLASSEHAKYPDNSMDFSITCPPYADVEQYNKIYGESKQDDLSSKDYEDFLKLYTQCLSEVYRVLKPGSFFVIIVGDVHRQGKYISLSNDTATICQNLGFIFHDENIYNRKSNIGGDLNYKTFILTCKRFPTIHEYILIFKKPTNSEELRKLTPPCVPKIEKDFNRTTPIKITQPKQTPLTEISNIKFIPPNPIEEQLKDPELGEIAKARLLRKLKEAQSCSQPLTQDMEGITLSKDIFEETMKLFKIKVKNCKYCNKPINKDNFGIITQDTFVCNDITCLFQAFEDLDKQNGSGGNHNGQF